MSPRLRWALFGIAALAQLALPLRYIWHGQQVLTQGSAYRVVTAPVDPYDPFRGRYVQLGFPDFPRGFSAPDGQDWYLPLTTGADGHAVFGTPQRERPAGGDYLRLAREGSRGGWLHPPFDRYYLDEDLAPRAEQAYRAAARRRPTDAVGRPEPVRAELAIRVLDGEAVSEMLYLDGQPIRDYLAAQR